MIFSHLEIHFTVPCLACAVAIYVFWSQKKHINQLLHQNENQRN